MSGSIGTVLRNCVCFVVLTAFISVAWVMLAGRPPIKVRRGVLDALQIEIQEYWPEDLDSVPLCNNANLFLLHALGDSFDDFSFDSEDESGDSDEDPA